MRRASGRSTVDRAGHRRRAARASPARSTSCRRCTRRSSTRARALYDYARAGVEVERDAAPRRDPSRIDIVEWHDADAGARRASAARAPTSARWPRTSARALGCGAHLAALRRTAQRPADARQARDASRRWQPWTRPSAMRCCCRADALLADWPARAPGRRRSRPLPHRPAPPRARWPTCRRVRVYGPERRAPSSAAAHITAGELIADRLLSPLEVQGLA
ncbi:MAG: hypothetical protein MZW92_45605 [Comamonadaceae bacterium]|nr:hypothetical protein [Comamonadaceae bacterium]